MRTSQPHTNSNGATGTSAEKSNAIELARFTNAGGPLNKRISSGPNDEPIKTAYGDMWQGKMERLCLGDWRDFAAELDKTPRDVAYGLGRMREDLPDSATLVTKDDPRDGTPGIAARSKDNLNYLPNIPAFAMFDVDTKGMPAAVGKKVQKFGGFTQAIGVVCHEFFAHGHIHRPSTSAGLINTKTNKRWDSVSQHIFVPIKDGSDAKRFLYAMHDRAWLGGLGWYLIGKAGQLLERSIIDRSVYSPERLVFEANPDLDPPWKQEPRKTTIHDGPMLDSRAACPDLDEDEQAEVLRLKTIAAEALAEEAEKQRQIFMADRIKEMTARGIELDKARAIAEQWTRRVLKPDVVLEFDDRNLAGITVRDVLADPHRFKEKTLADPIEGTGYGRGKAKLYVNRDGSVRVHSFAHGGADYKLVHDFASLETEIGKADNQSGKRLCKLVVDAELDQIDENQLAGMIAKQCHVTKASVVSMVNSDKDRRRRVESGENNLSIVTRFNKEFTYLYGQGVLRIMYDRVLDREYYDFCKTSMMREMFANELCVHWPQIGDPKEVTSFDMWMMSPNRNQYLGGAEFRPSALPFEVLPRYAPRIEKYGSDCLPVPYVSPPNVLNFWNGFGVTPRPDRSWKKLFDHILHVVCDGDRVAFLYVIRWMAYAVQFPEKQGETVLVLRGKEGTGKGIFARAFIKLFGRHGLQIVQPEHLTGKFNLHLRDVCALFADECFFAGNPAHVRILKGITTEPTITIEGKYLNAVPMANRLHIIIATNDDWAVDASLEARRYVVLDVKESHIEDFAYFGIQDELDNGGYEAMLYDLSHLPLGGFNAFNVRRIPKTSGLDEQKKLRLGTFDAWLKEVLTRGYVWETETGYDFFYQWFQRVTTELLFKSYERYARKHREYRPLSREMFGREMVGKGFRPARLSEKESIVGEVRDPEGTHPVKHGRKPGYDLGDLETAREEFITSLNGMAINWGEPEDQL